MVLLANTPTQAKTLLHCLERAEGGIGIHVTADKTECMRYNQRGNISALMRGPLKLVDKFSYLRSCVSSTENDINTRLAKPWTANDSLLAIWKSDLTDEIKRRFYKQQSCQYCYMDALRGRWLIVWRKSLTVMTKECCEQYWTSSGGSSPQNSSTWPPTTHHKNY